MTRPSSLVALVLAAVLAAGVIVLALGHASRVEAADAHRIEYVQIGGRGANARAWYYGAPPSGVPVQEALDKFAAEGLHFSGIAASSLVSSTQSGSVATDVALGDPTYVIVLER